MRIPERFPYSGHAQAVAGSESTQAALVDGFKHVEVASNNESIFSALYAQAFSEQGSYVSCKRKLWLERKFGLRY
jgi:hypothetical protein